VGHFQVTVSDTDFVMRIGLYDPVTGARLPTNTGADAVILDLD
jgi:hypothetical protein